MCTSISIKSAQSPLKCGDFCFPVLMFEDLHDKEPYYKEFTDIMLDCSDKEKKHIMQDALYAKQIIHDIIRLQTCHLNDSGIPKPLQPIHECDSCVLLVMFEIS